MALVSIIVPIYNVENYLDKCVQSIVDQSYKNLEIILVDDGSPDNCPKMCDEWAKKDERIVVIHKSNGGLSDARNVGIAASKGEYIGFVDGDDWIETNFVRLLAEKLDMGADIADCATRLCDEDNATILVRGAHENMSLASADALKLLLQENTVFQTVWNKLYKRNIIINTPFEFGKYHEDNFWTWQVFLSAEKVFLIKEPLYNYVQRGNSIMGENYSSKRLDGLEAVFECFSHLNSDKEYRELVSRKLVSDCMYNLQCTFKYLNGPQQKEAKRIITDYIKKSKIKANDKALNSVWLKAFIKCPVIISKIRNMLNIGF